MVFDRCISERCLKADDPAVIGAALRFQHGPQLAFSHVGLMEFRFQRPDFGEQSIDPLLQLSKASERAWSKQLHGVEQTCEPSALSLSGLLWHDRASYNMRPPTTFPVN